MLRPGAELSGPEMSQLRLVAAFARWAAEGEMPAWARIVLQVDGAPVSAARTLDALEARSGQDFSALRSGGRAAVVSTAEIEGYEEHLERTGAISARLVREHLLKRGLLSESLPLDVFALPGAPWDRSGVEEFVNLVLTLAGDLAQDLTLKLEKGLEEIRLIRIQA
jgi:hypothetical protein